MLDKHGIPYERRKYATPSIPPVKSEPHGQAGFDEISDPGNIKVRYLCITQSLLHPGGHLIVKDRKRMCHLNSNYFSDSVVVITILLPSLIRDSFI